MLVLSSSARERPQFQKIQQKHPSFKISVSQQHESQGQTR